MAKKLVSAEGGGSGGSGSTIEGTAGSDILHGGHFADQLYGFGGKDVLYGGGGGDWMEAGNGNDILVGGAGNDDLVGENGSDTYVFGRGDGQDRIYNSDTDAIGVRPDRILLEAGIAPTDVTLVQEHADLILKINGTDDQISIYGYFSGESASTWVVESIEFADGTVWSAQDIEALVPPQTSTEGKDYLEGGAGDDMLSGLGGYDMLYGYGGNDYLSGGAWVDLLDGGAGDDTLLGGADSDSLQGGEGNDTYLFNLGTGRDYAYEDHAAGTDRIVVGAGISADDVSLTRDDRNALILSIKGTQDVLEVSRFFDDDGFDLESIEFADGTSLDIDAIKVAVTTGTEGEDRLTGYKTGDVLDGLGGKDFLDGAQGNDKLYGGAGNDDIYGGLGKDSLTGGAGQDAFNFTALLGAKDVDTITDFVSGRDVIQLHWSYTAFTELRPLQTLDSDQFVASRNGNARDADDHVLYETDTGKLFYDADGNGAGAKVQLAVIGTDIHPMLAASDFEVVF